MHFALVSVCLCAAVLAPRIKLIAGESQENPNFLARPAIQSRELLKSESGSVEVSCTGESCDLIDVQHVSNVTTLVSRRDYGNSESAELHTVGPVTISFDSVFDVEPSASGCGYDFIELSRRNESAMKYCGVEPPPETEVDVDEQFNITWFSDGGKGGEGWSFYVTVRFPSPPPVPPWPPHLPPYPAAPPLETNGSTVIIQPSWYAMEHLSEAIANSYIVNIELYTDVSLTSDLSSVSKELSIIGLCEWRCTIDGAQAFQVLRVTGGGNLTLKNITLRNGLGGLGGALVVDGESSATILQSALLHNSADFGGAIYILDGTVTVEDTELSGNEAAQWGGMAFVERGELHLRGCIVEANTATKGAGFSATAAVIDVQGTSLESNSAVEQGGVYFFEQDGIEVTLRESVLRNNSATFGGVGRIQNLVTAVAEGCTFESNRAAAAAGGGGVFMISQNAALEVEGCWFHNSTAQSGGVTRFYGGKHIVQRAQSQP
ncbi:hypothetical protein CYMTET_27688, partial [Cymbomonas tetramitiformis]